MIAQHFAIHPTHPQRRLVKQAAEILGRGGLIAYPTDSCYALGCQLGDAAAVERIRRLRGFGGRHHLTLMCRDLSEIGRYAIVDDVHYRLLRAAIPGSYTFILRARREVPRRLMHERRKTIGVRVPGHAVAYALLEELNEPLLSATLLLPGDEQALADPEEIRSRLAHELDAVVDGGPCGVVPSTVIDLTGAQPAIVRHGSGSLDPFSIEPV